MRRISASFVFPVSQAPIRNGMVILDDNGIIRGLAGPDNGKHKPDKTDYYDGIVVPGFVNAHCHLELSHLKGKIQQGTGLGNFIGEINKLRNTRSLFAEDKAGEADRELYLQGIAAAGDISNTSLTLNIKLNSQVFYHSFIESFGFLPSRAEKAFKIAHDIYGEYTALNLSASIVPHSPYSVSGPLFERIIAHARKSGSILSIHNQESSGENRFFRNGTGPIARHLRNNLGLDTSGWIPTGKNSLESVLELFPCENTLILVHNTFSTRRDMRLIKEKRSPGNTFLCLCPNSNLYIEKKLPDIILFMDEKIPICLGTDSLASNQELSILSELKILQKNFPGIPLQEMITWSTINGARALGIENQFGSFEPGKRPGVNLITGIDPEKLELTSSGRITRLA